MTVSLCVVAYNEEQFLPNLLRDLEAQTYPHDLTEIVLIDGISSDSTKQIMKDFAQKSTSFYAFALPLNNPINIEMKHSRWIIAPFQILVQHIQFDKWPHTHFIRYIHIHRATCNNGRGIEIIWFFPGC